MRPNAIFAIICVVALSASAAFASPLPISEVVRMSGSGARPRDVIERLRVSQTSYALRGSDFGKLKVAGVSDEVLDYLQQSFVSDVETGQRRLDLIQLRDLCSALGVSLVRFVSEFDRRLGTRRPYSHT